MYTVIGLLNTASATTSLSHDAVVAAVASSVTVFILSSVLFFTIGYICGVRNTNNQPTASKETSEEIVCPDRSQTTPVYEGVLPKSISKIGSEILN